MSEMSCWEGDNVEKQNLDEGKNSFYKGIYIPKIIKRYIRHFDLSGDRVHMISYQCWVICNTYLGHINSVFRNLEALFPRVDITPCFIT